jgi:hypothetical protein
VQLQNEFRAVVSYDLAAGAWGSGVLTYEGKDYPFKVSRLSVVDVGMTSAELFGEVFDLRNVEDFNGTYKSFDAQDNVAGSATMKNQNGVVIKLVATTLGLKFKLPVGSMNVELEDR